MKKLWTDGYFDDTSALNHLKAPKIFSSKNERLIVEHFKQAFPEDEWTSGGNIKYEGTRLSRDMFSKKLKVCFEYDGDWHFIDIKGQLKDKQHKDVMLEKWCLENDYRLIRIDEKKFLNCKQIEKLIYEKTDQVIKIGNRYL